MKSHRNQWQPYKPQKQTFTMPSLTIPDQTMTVSEMVKQVTSVDAKVYKGVYHDEESIDTETGINPATMDIVEISEELAEIDARVKEHLMQKKAKQAEAEKEAYAKAEQEKREAWSKEWAENWRKEQEQKG